MLHLRPVIITFFGLILTVAALWGWRRLDLGVDHDLAGIATISLVGLVAFVFARLPTGSSPVERRSTSWLANTIHRWRFLLVFLLLLILIGLVIFVAFLPFSACFLGDCGFW